MKYRIRLFPVFVVALLLLPRPVVAWSECGHHIVCLIAFEQLNVNQQNRLLELLQAHPRYVEDFTPPGFVRDPVSWRVGTAGYWPDIARSQEAYNRPTWHYELGATLVVGSRDEANVPDSPGPLPAGATLNTQELHLSQAYELCRRIYADPSAAPADRAIALCWLGHILGDAHQPCHSGSLYTPKLFHDGDRGANAVRVVQSRNLHALWDDLLGGRFDEGDVQRRFRVITRTEELRELGAAAPQRPEGMNVQAWLQESRQFGIDSVYTPQILHPLRMADARGLERPPVIDLPESYLTTAGDVARRRVVEAGYRLAEVWKLGLE